MYDTMPRFLASRSKDAKTSLPSMMGSGWLEAVSEREGDQLSPVDLSISSAILIQMPHLQWHHYNSTPSIITVRNSGFTVMMHASFSEQVPYLSSGPLNGKYVFSQIHFHWGEHDETGSGHSVDGIRYPLEMHVVHIKQGCASLREAFEAKDGIVIAVYLFALREERNSHLDQLTAVLQFIKKPKCCARLYPMPLSEIVHPFVDDYFLYLGAVPGPSLRQYRIMWLVGRNVLPVSSQQLREFRQLHDERGNVILSNSSKPQPLGERSLFLVSPSGKPKETMVGICRHLTRSITTSESDRSIEICNAEFKSLVALDEADLGSCRICPHPNHSGYNPNSSIEYPLKIKEGDTSVEQSCLDLGTLHDSKVKGKPQMKRKNTPKEHRPTTDVTTCGNNCRAKYVPSQDTYSVISANLSEIHLKRRPLFIKQNDPSTEQACMFLTSTPSVTSARSAPSLTLGDFLTIKQERTQLSNSPTTKSSNEIAVYNGDLDYEELNKYHQHDTDVYFSKEDGTQTEVEKSVVQSKFRKVKIQDFKNVYHYNGKDDPLIANCQGTQVGSTFVEMSPDKEKTEFNFRTNEDVLLGDEGHTQYLLVKQTEHKKSFYKVIGEFSPTPETHPMFLKHDNNVDQTILTKISDSPDNNLSNEKISGKKITHNRVLLSFPSTPEEIERNKTVRDGKQIQIDTSEKISDNGKTKKELSQANFNYRINLRVQTTVSDHRNLGRNKGGSPKEYYVTKILPVRKPVTENSDTTKKTSYEKAPIVDDEEQLYYAKAINLQKEEPFTLTPPNDNNATETIKCSSSKCKLPKQKCQVYENSGNTQPKTIIIQTLMSEQQKEDYSQVRQTVTYGRSKPIVDQTQESSQKKIETQDFTSVTVPLLEDPMISSQEFKDSNITKLSVDNLIPFKTEMSQKKSQPPVNINDMLVNSNQSSPVEITTSEKNEGKRPPERKGKSKITNNFTSSEVGSGVLKTGKPEKLSGQVKSRNSQTKKKEGKLSRFVYSKMSEVRLTQKEVKVKHKIYDLIDNNEDITKPDINTKHNSVENHSSSSENLIQERNRNENKEKKVTDSNKLEDHLSDKNPAPQSGNINDSERSIRIIIGSHQPRSYSVEKSVYENKITTIKQYNKEEKIYITIDPNQPQKHSPYQHQSVSGKNVITPLSNNNQANNKYSGITGDIIKAQKTSTIHNEFTTTAQKDESTAKYFEAKQTADPLPNTLQHSNQPTNVPETQVPEAVRSVEPSRTSHQHSYVRPSQVSKYADIQEKPTKDTVSKNKSYTKSSFKYETKVEDYRETETVSVHFQGPDIKSSSNSANLDNDTSVSTIGSKGGEAIVPKVEKDNVIPDFEAGESYKPNPSDMNKKKVQEYEIKQESEKNQNGKKSQSIRKSRSVYSYHPPSRSDKVEEEAVVNPDFDSDEEEIGSTHYNLTLKSEVEVSDGKTTRLKSIAEVNIKPVSRPSSLNNTKKPDNVSKMITWGQNTKSMVDEGCSAINFPETIDSSVNHAEVSSNEEVSLQEVKFSSINHSPIRIETGTTVVKNYPPLLFLNHWNGNLEGDGLLENNGKILRVTYLGDAQLLWLRGGPLEADYIFAELHFHWGRKDCCGAEHIIDGQRHTLEAHFLYFKKEYGSVTEALNYTDGLAVVVIQLNVGGPPDPQLGQLIKDIWLIRDAESGVYVPPESMFSWMKDTVEKANGYFTYKGTMTLTPPYVEAVTWLVFPEPIVFCCQQSLEFRKLRSLDGELLLKTKRPSQPLNNRTVLYVPL